ncbi:uncharacterized protein CG5098 [Anopheles cruzii]|uniref:uncharacterized protein CG5098 n=1 Tax=Anopheles cruzii TaxID=68878 RepID=UPI0022EC702C|nr:uncharacterized protein CG5098 [Anopheles cruzii]
MSGHNPPHGRLGQPSTTWNPLQVPSYVPRQPQLAHMSSERSMARSPLTWHTPPTHQDKVYNLMTGNLMNSIENNPLLQGYGRTSVGIPLGSVDLSLSSVARSTPSPKANHPHNSSSSVTLPSNIPAIVHTTAADHTSNLTRITTTTAETNLVPSATASVIQSTANTCTTTTATSTSAAAAVAAALKDCIQGTYGSQEGGNTTTNFSNATNDGSHTGSTSGGGNGFGVPPVLGCRVGSDIASFMTGGLLIKDAKQINSEMESKNGRDCFSHLTSADSSDLVKDFIMHAIQNSNSLPVSPKRTSPQRTSVQSSYSPDRSRSPASNLLHGSSTLEAKLGLDCVNNTFPTLNCNNTPMPLRLNAEIKQSTSAESTEASNNGVAVTSLASNCNPAASPTNNSITSNEDSVDSSSGCSKSRRRRKPERTSKMNPTNVGASDHEEGQPFFGPEPKAMDGILEPLRSNIAGRSDITAFAIEGINALSKCLPGVTNSHPAVTDLPESSRLNSIHASRDHHLPAVQTGLVEAPQNLIQSNSTLSSSSVSTVGISPVIRVASPQTMLVPPAALANSCTKFPLSASGLSVAAATVAAAIESVRKNEPEDCNETIGKIAAMVSCVAANVSMISTASTAHGEASFIGNGTEHDTGETNCNGPVAQHKTSATVHQSKGKLNEKDNASESSYEEVENKLEQMFAGIEEEKADLSTKSIEGNMRSGVSGNNGCRSIDDTADHCSRSEDKKSCAVTDGDVLKQLSCDSITSEGEQQQGKKTESVESSKTVTPETSATSAAGSGRKPLTPAQKRANGTNSMETSTPIVKRKRAPKKKGNAYSAKGNPFLEPDTQKIMGLKALAKGKGKCGKAFGSSGKTKGKAGKKMNAAPNSSERISAAAVTTATNWAGPSSSADITYSKHKGPYVQVKANGNHTVINAPINDEDDEKPQSKLAKKFSTSHNVSERSKIRGLHVSTLSTKYDADTTDTSWMCVFCKTGPHKFRLGDLFGPYIISTDSNEYKQSEVDLDFFSVKRTRETLESKQAKQRRVAEQQQQQKQSGGSKGRKRKNAGATSNATIPSEVPSKSSVMVLKEEKSEDVHRQQLEDIFYGMVTAGDNTYEVWTHEECLVWAPGVHMVGTRVIGLEAAIWNCCRHRCQFCSYNGAVVSCLSQGCTAKAHFICAHKQNWKLTKEYKSFCELHSASVKEPADSGRSGVDMSSSSYR